MTQQRKQGTETQRVCVSWALACECERVCVVVKCECGGRREVKSPGVADFEISSSLPCKHSFNNKKVSLLQKEVDSLIFHFEKRVF